MIEILTVNFLLQKESFFVKQDKFRHTYVFFSRQILCIFVNDILWFIFDYWSFFDYIKEIEKVWLKS